jgi:Fe-S-cluster containining protein
MAEHWFTRTRALLGDLPCRRGCFRCCIGPFAITILDRAALQCGLASLDEQVRRDIEEKADRQRSAMERAFPRLAELSFVDDWADEDINRLVEQFADVPCPALGSDGACRVYAFRPITCRTMGIPVETGGVVEGACEVQTAVPLIRPSSLLRHEEQTLANQEAADIAALRRKRPMNGEEMLLPYGFLIAPSF